MPAGGAAALAPTFRAAAADGPAESVAATLADVRARGDAAVLDAIRAFDAPGFDGADALVDPEEVDAAVAALDPVLRDAIDFAAAQVRAVAEFAPEFVEIKPWGACGPLAVWIDRRCDTAAVAARLKGAAAAGPAAP
jgi:histidinol dehydrogenase